MLIDIFNEMTFFVATISALMERTHYCQTFLFFVFSSQANSNLMIVCTLPIATKNGMTH